MVEQKIKNKLINELENTIKKYGINDKRNYKICKILAIENDKKNNNKALQNYYLDSLVSLIKYMKQHEENPSENKWNKYAIENRCLSSKTMGYIYEDGFNKLCRKIRKELKKEFLL